MKITGGEDLPGVAASLCSLWPHESELCYDSASKHGENHSSGLMGSGSAVYYTDEAKNPGIPTF